MDDTKVGSDTAGMLERYSRGRPHVISATEKEQRVEEFCRGIRAKLKDIREQLGLDQTDVAIAMEIGQPTVSRIENGTGDIGLKTLCRYADAVGMRPYIAFMPSHSQLMEQIAEAGVVQHSEEGIVAVAEAMQSAGDVLLDAVSDAIPAAMKKMAVAA
jgi:transcriptional regulator with XRE-family HTH domain